MEFQFQSFRTTRSWITWQASCHWSMAVEIASSSKASAYSQFGDLKCLTTNHCVDVERHGETPRPKLSASIVGCNSRSYGSGTRCERFPHKHIRFRTVPGLNAVVIDKPGLAIADRVVDGHEKNQRLCAHANESKALIEFSGGLVLGVNDHYVDGDVG